MELIEEWYRHYGLDVFNYLVYRVGTRDVDDLVQETFIRALYGVHRFKHDSSPKTWLIAIAKNVATDFYRKNRRRRQLRESTFDAPLTHEPIDKLIDAMDAKESINQFLRDLKPAHQDVVIMRGILEMSTAETAQILGWSESKVKVTWHRALKVLRDRLGKE